MKEMSQVLLLHCGPLIAVVVFFNYIMSALMEHALMTRRIRPGLFKRWTMLSTG